MKWDFEGDFIMQFESNFRGIIGHKFCQAVREGCEDVSSILDYVRQFGTKDGRPVWLAVARTCETSEAWDFAQHMLDRENLSDEDKRRLKNESKSDNDFVKAKMAADEPTFKQLNYLEMLRCPVVPKTKLEASELIDGLLKNANPKKPSVVDLDSVPF